MPDRTINFGDDAADARYRIQDTSSTGGDFVLAEDLDGGIVLLEYDYSASEFVSRGPVNLDGNDITNAGSITAGTLEATKVSTGRTWQDELANRSLNTTETNTTGSDIMVQCTVEANSDNTEIGLNWRGDVFGDNHVDFHDTGDYVSIQTIVPDGRTYEASAFRDTAGYDLTEFKELKP